LMRSIELYGTRVIPRVRELLAGDADAMGGIVASGAGHR
jgi:hypothetical protein